eukprot:309386-Hanusia_phi.AAC.3
MPGSNALSGKHYILAARNADGETRRHREEAQRREEGQACQCRKMMIGTGPEDRMSWERILYET